MPVAVGESINYFTDIFLKAPLVHKITKNPIYTALLITFIIILVVLFIFRDAETEESLLIMSLRTGFWMFFMTLGILFVHNKVLAAEIDVNTKNDAYDGVFTGAYGGANTPGIISNSVIEDALVPVKINTDFTL